MDKYGSDMDKKKKNLTKIKFYQKIKEKGGSHKGDTVNNVKSLIVTGKSLIVTEHLLKYFHEKLMREFFYLF